MGENIIKSERFTCYPQIPPKSIYRLRFRATHSVLPPHVTLETDNVSANGGRNIHAICWFDIIVPSPLGGRTMLTDQPARIHKSVCFHTLISKWLIDACSPSSSIQCSEFRIILTVLKNTAINASRLLSVAS